MGTCPSGAHHPVAAIGLRHQRRACPVRGPEIGASFQGLIHDAQGNMDMTGTIMLAYGINRLFAEVIAKTESDVEGTIYYDFALQHAGKNLLDQMKFPGKDLRQAFDR